MIRRFFAVFAILTVWQLCAAYVQAAGNEIITEAQAAQHGLTRSWFSQVEMDGGRSRLKDLVLYDGILYVQTDRAMVHAIDAETGATLWAKQIGRPEHPSLTPGVGRNLLAIINGSRLYVVNRFDGKILLETNIDAAPGAGPAVSDQRVFVPTVMGMLLSYRVEEVSDPLKEAIKETPVSPEDFDKQKTEDRQSIHLSQQAIRPLTCQSKGRTLVQPVVTRQNEAEEYVVWPTDQGFMYIGRIDRDAATQIDVKYRLQTAAAITAQPTYLYPDPKILGDSGIILAASGDGYIHAIIERNGETLWRFSTGEPLSQPAVVINEQAYAATSLSGMYCINIKNGRQMWYAPGIVKFVAASQNHVYCVDKLGLTRVLDASTGAQLDILPTAALPVKMLNTDTDRVYLATSKGLIQCLHEIALTKPLMHGEQRKIAAEESAKSSKAAKSKPKTSEAQPEAKDAVETKAANEENKDAAAAQPNGGEEKPAPDAEKKTEVEKDPFGE
jgi:outer membrane protein assembly factor BamB